MPWSCFHGIRGPLPPAGLHSPKFPFELPEIGRGVPPDSPSPPGPLPHVWGRGESLREIGAKRTRLQKSGGWGPPPSTTAPGVAVRRCDEQSFPNLPRTARGTSQATARAAGPDSCVRMDVTALVTRASVRPESQWGTDLFAPLISHAFSYARWRTVVNDRWRALTHKECASCPRPHLRERTLLARQRYLRCASASGRDE